MKLRLVLAFAAVLSIVSLVFSGGCQSEPPPPEEPNFDQLRDKLDATKQDMASAQEKLSEVTQKAEAERQAKQAASQGDEASAAEDADTAAKPTAEEKSTDE